jgi:hypothetical protein
LAIHKTAEAAETLVGVAKFVRTQFVRVPMEHDCAMEFVVQQEKLADMDSVYRKVNVYLVVLLTCVRPAKMVCVSRLVE